MKTPTTVEQTVIDPQWKTDLWLRVSEYRLLGMAFATRRQRIEEMIALGEGYESYKTELAELDSLQAKVREAFFSGEIREVVA